MGWRIDILEVWMVLSCNRHLIANYGMIEKR